MEAVEVMRRFELLPRIGRYFTESLRGVQESPDHERDIERVV